MEDLLLKMIEDAKTNRTKLIQLKVLAVKLNQYELASKLKDLENELFPMSKKDTELKKHAKDVAGALAMCELNTSEEVAFVIYSAVKVSNKKRGSFSLKDAAQILAKKSQLYPTAE